MFTSVVLAAALALPGAPIPRDTATSGPVPRIMEFKPGTDGKVMLTVLRQEVVKVAVATVAAPGAAPQVVEREVTQNRYVQVELADVKDVVATTAAGKTLDTKEVLQKLSKGGIAVVSADGKPVDNGYLKLFKDDTIVLASPELVNVRQGMTTGPVPLPGRPGIRPLPAPVPVPAVGGAAGGIQIQVVPAVAPPVQAPPPPEKK